MVLVAAFLVLELAAYAQQPTESAQQAPQSPVADNSSGTQPGAATPSNSDDALEVPVLEQMEEGHITYMESHIALKYSYDEFEEGSNLNWAAVHWLQTLGPSKRLAVGIEIPFVNFNGEGEQPDGSGIGDI